MSRPPTTIKTRIATLVLSLSLLLTLVALGWRELGSSAPHVLHQQRFRQLAAAAGRRVEPAGPVIHRLSVAGRQERCLSCHRGVVAPALPGKQQNPHRAHPGKLLRWHPPGRFGCVSCHGAGGGYVDRCLPASGDRHGRALGAAMARASCRGCHREADNLPGAGALLTGLRAYRRLGCAGCHREKRLDRRSSRDHVAPPLDGVSSKLHLAHLGAFLSGPQHKRPGTAMPTFFDSQLMRGAPAFSVQQIRGQRFAQLRALLAFLLTLRPQSGSPGADPVAASGDARRGRTLLTTLGCVACHRVDPRSPPATPDGAVPGPDLSAAGTRLRQAWIFRWLRSPRGWFPGSRMPEMRLSAGQRADIAAHLVTLGKAPARPQFLPPTNLAPAGQALARKLGCAGCHRLRSLQQAPPAGPELDGFGDKPLELLDWGHATIPPAQRTRARWVRTKLTTPLAFDRPPGVLRMPWQHLRPGELLGLQQLLRSLTRAGLPARWIAKPSLAARRHRRGERLVQEQGCRRCHRVAGKGGKLASLPPRPSLRPPSLDGEGGKVRPAWLHGFLLRPTALRPWLGLRMPGFNLTSADADTLTAYFAATARASYPFVHEPPVKLQGPALQQALELFQKLKCVSCHQLSNAPQLKPGELAPDLALSGARLRRSWIRRFILQPQQLMPGTRMPTLFPLLDEDRPGGGRITPAPATMGGDIPRQVDALTDLNLLWGTMSVSGRNHGAAKPGPH